MIWIVSFLLSGVKMMKILDENTCIGLLNIELRFKLLFTENLRDTIFDELKIN